MQARQDKTGTTDKFGFEDIDCMVDYFPLHDKYEYERDTQADSTPSLSAAAPALDLTVPLCYKIAQMPSDL